MPREAALPSVFERYAHLVHYVQRVSEIEYSSSCPRCGGSVHDGGEWPDRCRWFLDGSPVGWCRRCSAGKDGLFWPSENYKPDPDEIERRRQERIQHEESRKRSAERALEHLHSSRQWEIYNEQMGDAGRTYWRNAGLPDGWQDYWRLGWASNHPFGGVTCDAASIPIFGPGWEIGQIKYRLMDESKGRYRKDPSGTDAMPFLCDPDADYSKHVVAIEGEKKAAVAFTRLGDGKLTIIGMPGTSAGQPMLDLLKDADRITLVVDPGAKPAGLKTAKVLGVKRCRLLETQVKLDDFIIANNTTKRQLEWLLKGATVLSAFVLGK